MANERYMEVLLTVLGGETDVAKITKQHIQQLIECDDVPPDQLVGVEAIHKHLKLYKSLLKTSSQQAKQFI